MFEILSICRRTNKLLIRTALLLSTSFTQFLLSVNLLIKVQLDEILLLRLLRKPLLDLDQGFFWSTVRLIVERLNGSVGLIPCFLLCNLVLKEVKILSVLILPVLCLNVLHAIHVVHCLVELVFLVLSDTLNTLSLLLKAIKGLLVRFTNGIV